MYRFTILFFFYLVINCRNATSTPIGNGTDPNVVSNGKTNNTCKTDDGRIEIPLNSKLRSGLNLCQVCTCTMGGFLCEDQCETIQASTSIGTSTDSTSISSTSLDPSSASSTTITAMSASQININPLNPTGTSSISLNGGVFGNETIGLNGSGSCAILAANGLLIAREYAFVDCSEVYLAGKRTTGVYEIWPRASSKPFRVLCDMDTDGGGWTVIQHRGDYAHQSNFFVPWSSYKRGFGDLARDFWLGNEKIHLLTNQDEYRLHIDMEDFTDQTRFVEYEWFFITNEQTKYTLNLGRYMASSTGGDSFSYNRGMRFTTRDQDNDQSMSSQCAENYKSGWWHAGCTLVNLNGLYLRGNDSTATGVFWNNWLGAKYSLKSCSIKVRPTTFNTEMLS